MVSGVYDHSCEEVDGENQDQPATGDPQGSENITVMLEIEIYMHAHLKCSS
jgi:hypothetical protein